MKPVWIKYYGLIPMTRNGYLITLALAALFAAMAMLLALAFGRLPPLSTLWAPDPAAAANGVVGLFYNYLYWIIIICLVAQMIDTSVTLRLFSQKEAEQLAALTKDWDQFAENRSDAERVRGPGTNIKASEHGIQDD